LFNIANKLPPLTVSRHVSFFEGDRGVTRGQGTQGDKGTGDKGTGYLSTRLATAGQEKRPLVRSPCPVNLGEPIPR